MMCAETIAEQQDTPKIFVPWSTGTMPPDFFENFRPPKDSRKTLPKDKFLVIELILAQMTQKSLRRLTIVNFLIVPNVSGTITKMVLNSASPCFSLSIIAQENTTDRAS